MQIIIPLIRAVFLSHIEHKDTHPATLQHIKLSLISGLSPVNLCKTCSDAIPKVFIYIFITLAPRAFHFAHKDIILYRLERLKRVDFLLI